MKPKVQTPQKKMKKIKNCSAVGFFIFLLLIFVHYLTHTRLSYTHSTLWKKHLKIKDKSQIEYILQTYDWQKSCTDL
jgi:hypothetical protein